MAAAESVHGSRRAIAGVAAMMVFAGALSMTAGALAADEVPSREAARHIGKTVTICGPVAGASHFARLKGEPTFLNFDRRHPEQTFTVVIWGKDARRFPRRPHLMFADKHVCVTGTVETYQGKPQIVVRDPAQIVVAEQTFAADLFTREERILLKALLRELGHETDPGDSAWDPAADAALRSFQAQAGLAEAGERNPQTLRALAAAVDALDAEARGRVLKLVLLNLAQREEAPSR